MSKRSGAIWFALLAVLFLAANREAYRSYFQDDEIDNLSWTGYAPATQYLRDALTPRFFENNFRPVGYFYFHAAGNAFGLDYPKYVAVIQAFHLLNAWLIWLLARRLGAAPIPAAAACVFFAFHMALFDAFWKPMYVFDLLCGTFCLLSLLFYSKGIEPGRRHRLPHQGKSSDFKVGQVGQVGQAGPPANARLRAIPLQLLSFAAFWLAYKSKEVAVMLPLALACYEFWFGQRRWAKLVPFVLVSLSFGLQGLLLNPNHDNDYTFRFTLAALKKTVGFYSGRVFLVPYLGLALPLAALAARNRRTWFGLAMMAVFFVPMLFLPGRIFSTYCYVPFTGLAIAVAGLAEAAPPAAVVVFFLLCLQPDVHAFRLQRRETLARAAEAREWIATLARFSATAPAVDAFVYSGTPRGFERWGVEGSVKYLFHRLDVQVRTSTEPPPPGRVALLTWDAARHKLEISLK